MANFTISPNMNLAIPNVGVDPGPDYANNLNASLIIIDQHNHAAGSGVPINPDGIDINADLAFNGNNATFLRSSRYNIQVSPLSNATDISCAYAAGAYGDLYWNDGAGNQIQITKNAGVNATSSGISSGTASASFVAGTLVVNAAALTPANIQGASLLMGNNVANTNYLTLEPPSAMASSFTITLPNIPSVPSFMELDASGNMSGFTPINGGIIGQMLAPRPLGTSAGNISVSLSSGNAVISGTSYGNVTNLGVNITTTGKPVVLMVVPDGVSNGYFSAPSTFGMGIRIVNVTNSNFNVGGVLIGGGAQTNFFPASLTMIDTSVIGTSTTWVYNVQAFVGSGSGLINSVILVAYELH